MLKVIKEKLSKISSISCTSWKTLSMRWEIFPTLSSRVKSRLDLMSKVNLRDWESKRKTWTKRLKNLTKTLRKLKMTMQKRHLKTTKKFLILRNKSTRPRLKLSFMYSTEIEKPMVNKLVNKDNTIRLKMNLRKKLRCLKSKLRLRN
jgi:hypothetical protein